MVEMKRILYLDGGLDDRMARRDGSDNLVFESTDTEKGSVNH